MHDVHCFHFTISQHNTRPISSAQFVISRQHMHLCATTSQHVLTRLRDLHNILQNTHLHTLAFLYMYKTYHIDLAAEFMLFMCPANGRRRYTVMSSLIGWAHAQIDPCGC